MEYVQGLIKAHHEKNQADRDGPAGAQNGS